MGAGCYLCEKKYDPIPGNRIGDAVGACKLCGVLACLAHGMRSASRPAYICGCCVPNLLAVAAVKHLGTGDSPLQPSPSGDKPSPDTPSGFSQWAIDISKVDDVISDLAHDRWKWLRDDTEYLSRLLGQPGSKVSAVLAFARPDADQARDLMAAAAAFATHLRLPPDEMILVLQQVGLDVRVA